MNTFSNHYRSEPDLYQVPHFSTPPQPRPAVIDWPPPSLEKPTSRLQRMMAPTRLLKKTAKETKEFVGFTPSGRGVKVTAGRVDEIFGSKGDVPQPTLTSQLYPHPDQKPLPQEPIEEPQGGYHPRGPVENDMDGDQAGDGNPEYTPSARAKVLPWVTEMQQTPPQTTYQTPHDSSTQYQTAASLHDPLSAAEYARADGTGQVEGPGFVRPPPGLKERDTWIEEQSLERERLAREYEGENSFERDQDENDDDEGGRMRRNHDDDGSGGEGDSTSQQGSGKEGAKEAGKREKRKHRHHHHKHGRRHHHRHGRGGDKSKSKSKSRTTKQSKGADEVEEKEQGDRSHQEDTSATRTPTQTGRSAGLASDVMSRGATKPGQTHHLPSGEGLGMSGFAPGPRGLSQEQGQGQPEVDRDQPGFGQSQAPTGQPGTFYQGAPAGAGLGMSGMPWGQPGQPRPMEHNLGQPYGPVPPPNQGPGGPNQGQGLSDPYHQGYFHPNYNMAGQDGQGGFPYGAPFQGMSRPVVYPVNLPMPGTAFPGDNPASSNNTPPVPDSRSATDPETVQREQDQAIEAHLADLQQRMLRSAEESRQALAREKEERDREAARKYALDALGGARGGKDSRSPASVKSGKSRRGDQQANYPPEAKYVHTNAGNIKTYEEVRKILSRNSTTDQSETTDKTTGRKGEREPKRKTKETFVTDTTGPSFGHFGRPFSHEILGGGVLGRQDILEEEEIFSPLGGGAPIIVMRRVTHEEGPPFGSGLNALFGHSAGPKDHRSAYVETVEDEEHLLSPRTRGNVTSRDSSRSHTPLASRQPGQAPNTSSNREPTRMSGCRRTNKGSDEPNQGSAVANDKPVPPLPMTYASVPQPRPHLRPPLSSNPANRMSTATTTMSLVNQIVTDSRFHDDALCDLLRAARDDSLGDAAKKAVRRAARERVMDLTGMRQKYSGRADSEKTVTPAPRDRSARSSSDLDDEEPPAWSRALFDMLEHTNARLDALDQRMSSGTQTGVSNSLPPEDDEEERAARAALHNLLFPDLPMDIPLFGSGPYATPPRSQFRASQNPAHISDLRTEERTIGQLPDWGSSVDIPDGSSVPTAPPVRTTPIAPLGPPIAPLGAPIAPTIHVQPPTAQASTAGGARSHVTRASPRSTSQKVVDDAQSVGGMSRRTARSKARDQQSPASIKSQHRTIPAMSEKSVRAETENVYEDPLLPPLPSPRPWDVVTQRLFSWAMVWPPEDFVRSLETTALGQQVDEFALTIYMMTIFKRNLRHRMCSVPPLPCDKLFVPPNLADSVNRAVHSKRFTDARQILEELWYPFGFKEPPRVIVALAKHRNDANHWSAHRFDLTSGKLVTFSYSTEEKSLVDGRPFMWWFAIRDAWPTWNIPHPDHLAQKTQRVITPESSRDDNALMAANCGRNLMLGWKPDQSTDLKKMRNNIWNETKRLYERKAKGKLAVDSRDY